MVRFSVVIPVYNRAKYVRQAIDSVLTQTFTDYEVIAVDDGSTDGSADILESYGTRIKTIRQANHGPEVARNAAAAIAQGEYLVFLDSDDFLFPSALSIYDRMIRHIDAPPIVMGLEVYYEDGQPIPVELSAPSTIRVLKFRDYLSKTISLSNFNSKLAIRKSLFDEVGGCRNSSPETWLNDDLHLMLKVGTYGPLVVVQNVYTAAYRQHEGNTIKNVKAIADSLFPLVQAERRGEYPGGSQRRIDRYAVIGGRSANWAVRYCWRSGQRRLALQLLWRTAPMVAATFWKRLSRSFRARAQPIVLPEP